MEWYRKNFKAGEANNSTPFEANSLARSSVLMSIFFAGYGCFMQVDLPIHQAA